MFYGRKKELDILQKRYQGDSFECIILYGRRRIGKTALIDAFCKNKECIFFSAIDGTAQENLETLSAEIYRFSHPGAVEAPVYGSFQAAFQEIDKLADHHRLIFVVDEYPYLAKAEPSVSSRLQHLIDHEWAKSRLFVILCGSSMSFMEKQVLGYESPLYGRRTAQIRLEAMSYSETAAFAPKLSPAAKALLYGITGGIPHYIRKLYQGGSMDHALLENVFDRAAYLYEEPENLLKQELREPAVYSAVLSAIAGGASRLNEIATKTGITTAACTKYLVNLISLGIVDKETPIAEKEGKKTIYRISDQFFRFWYRFVRLNRSQINTGRIHETYDEIVKKHLPDYMGQTFEMMCREYVMRHEDLFPLTVTRAGRWWGTDGKNHKEVEIDIVCETTRPGAYIFVSCKFRNERVGVDELDHLINAAGAFAGSRESYYCLFSKSGFTKELQLKAKQDGVFLVELKDMYEKNGHKK